MKPYCYKIWNEIKKELNNKLDTMEIEEAYFPMFITEETLSKEKDHLEGFTSEVAWVTKVGETDLEKKLAIRPTSETIMYPYFSKWIRTYKNLPLKINQWCNVVRWEFKDPTSLIRAREFLWHEAHTVHATEEEAIQQVENALSVYENIYENLLAVPVIKGIKTQAEKFAGADQTMTIEGYVMEAGKGIQAGTSHNLGKNFAKMFNIEFENKEKEKHNPYQTSFGLTIRSIGLMIMTHSDNKGLILPPKIAPIQIIIIPILSKKCSANDEDELLKQCNYFHYILSKNFRVKLDNNRDNTAGYKYNYYELKGVPLRIEVGKEECENSEICLYRRDTNTKEKIDIKTTTNDEFNEIINEKLESIQSNLYEKAKQKVNNNVIEITLFDEFVENLKQGKMVLTPFYEDIELEEIIKIRCREKYNLKGIKTLCKPLKQNNLDNMKCFASDNQATCWVLWGKSY